MASGKSKAVRALVGAGALQDAVRVNGLFECVAHVLSDMCVYVCVSVCVCVQSRRCVTLCHVFSLYFP